MAKHEYINKWKTYHEYLTDSKQRNILREEIQRINGYSYSTFFIKLRNPQKLSIAEKKSIAEVYKLPATFLFPELETEAA